MRDKEGGNNASNKGTFFYGGGFPTGIPSSFPDQCRGGKGCSIGQDIAVIFGWRKEDLSVINQKQGDASRGRRGRRGSAGKRAEFDCLGNRWNENAWMEFVVL